jgi:hypothetical protein
MTCHNHTLPDRGLEVKKPTDSRRPANIGRTLEPGVRARLTERRSRRAQSGERFR